MVDTVRDWIVQQTGWRNLRDIDEEERLRMGANALALLRGWIGSSIIHGGTPLAEVVEALELVDQVLAPAPPPPPVDVEREVSSRLT